MDTFVTPLCCKVFCSFYVGNFFFQNTLLDFVARISIKTVQIIIVLHVCIILGFNNTSSHFFFSKKREGGKRWRKTTVRGIQKEAREEEERLPNSNKKVVCLVPS